MSKLQIFCDGGARGNPGPAAAAFVVFRGEGKVHEQSKYLGRTTNNVAEYEAVLMALDWLIKNFDPKNLRVEFFLDSELVVKQINGIYKVKNTKLQTLHQKILGLLAKFLSRPIIRNVLRQHNKQADLLVNKRLDKISR